MEDLGKVKVNSRNGVLLRVEALESPVKGQLEAVKLESMFP